MMRREAHWLGERLKAFSNDEINPMLSVGSGNKAFRASFQPWIETDVYEPLAQRGIVVLHHEIAESEGVDVAGDLGEQAVRDRLQELGVRTVLCLNVFEHVTDRTTLADALVASLPPGGLLVVTVPKRYPYHADPIDTLFRPTSAELAALFKGVEVVDSGPVRCESLLSHWLSKPGKLEAVRKARGAARGGSPPASATVTDHRQFGGPSIASMMAMLFVSTEVSYVILRKTTESQ